MARYHGWGMFYPVEPGTVDACGQAKCAYCGRYGVLGSCDSCGAPNQPVVLTDPGPLRPRIEVTAFGDCKARYVAGLPEK